jgi:hypothetical protein
MLSGERRFAEKDGSLLADHLSEPEHPLRRDNRSEFLNDVPVPTGKQGTPKWISVLHATRDPSTALSFASRTATSLRMTESKYWRELALLPWLHCRRYHRPSHRHDRALRRIGRGMGASEHFFLNVLHELLDLALHFFHALAHLQNDRHAADVHAQVARQRQDEFQPLEVFVRVETCIAFGARRFQQSLALVEAQRLGMDAIHFSDRGNHVRAF